MALFTHRVMLLIGGARGMGRATALALAREGATVIVSDRLESGAETPLVPLLLLSVDPVVRAQEHRRQGEDGHIALVDVHVTTLLKTGCRTDTEDVWWHPEWIETRHHLEPKFSTVLFFEVSALTR